MIFLIPIIIIIAIIFGIDHVYFKTEDTKLVKQEDNLSKPKINPIKVLMKKKASND